MTNQEAAARTAIEAAGYTITGVRTHTISDYDESISFIVNRGVDMDDVRAMFAGCGFRSYGTSSRREYGMNLINVSLPLA